MTKKIEVFASEALPGELEEFPDIKRGWGTTKGSTCGIPPMKWFNAIQKRTDEAINALATGSINGHSFEEGAILESKNDFIYDEGSKLWYFWGGDFPKVVHQGGSPDGENWFVFSVDDIKDTLLSDGTGIINHCNDGNCISLKKIIDMNGVYPEMFGAISTNGSSKPIDSTVAIQKAYSLAMSLGVPLIIKGRHYGITNLSFFDDVPSSGMANGTTIIGNNSGTYLRVLTDSDSYDKNKASLIIGNEKSYLKRLVVENIIVLPWDKETLDSGDGILLRKASNGSRMLGVEVRGMKDGIVINDSFTVNFTSCNFSQNRRHGVYAPKVITSTGSFTYNNNIGFINCVCNFNLGSGIFTESRSVSVISTNCEGNKSHQFSAEGADVFIEGMYCETLPKEPYACINLKDCNGGFISSNYLDTWGGEQGDKTLIRLTGTTHGVTVFTGGYNVRSGTKATIVDLGESTEKNTVFALMGNTISDKSSGKNTIVWTDKVKNSLNGESSVKHYGVVNHGLKTKPSNINITPVTTDVLFISVIPDSINENSFSISIKRPDGNVHDGVVKIMWSVS